MSNSEDWDRQTLLSWSTSLSSGGTGAIYSKLSDDVIAVGLRVANGRVTLESLDGNPAQNFRGTAGRRRSFRAPLAQSSHARCPLT